ncbi:Sec20-domain-containing protein [Neolentinus lepideus HHB14362 ss-1]|uniref:Sec20-domain-containing protein n=1 Tax=Neolentinus lepideus HHB14362 ss-1 TaxID=1314782 RepID=A0A165SV96_9AGAM|nr:Sec20-domain-containing protein [Neolentinus lepideus HHB14362 ss-1]
MPPLPTTLNKEAQVLIQSIERRRKDIQDTQIPRFQGCKGPLSVQQAYSASLREDIDYLVRQVEELELMVEEQRSERDRRELGRVVQDFLDEIGTIRKSARAAVLVSKRAVDSQSASNRDELLRTSTTRNQAKEAEEKGTGDALMKANADVTAALRRTIGLMQTELEKSVLSTQMLEQSSATLRSTSTAYDTMNMVLGASKQLVTALEKSDWLDRLLIISALVFFFLVVALILKARIVDRSLRIAFFWTRFIPRSNASKQLAEKDLEAATALTAALSTLSSAAASTLSSAVTSAASLRVPEPVSSEPPLASVSNSDISSSEQLLESTYLPPDFTPISTPVSSTSDSDFSAHDEL